jgi:hypothetical protein
MDVKNALEVFELVKTAGIQAQEVMKDGKVNIFDLPKLAPLVGPARKAIQDANLIAGEIKDLDGEEAQLLATAAIEAVLAWVPVIPQTAET